MKSFLAAGDVLLNPSLLAFAIVETDSEGPRLRLGFNGAGGIAPGEVLLVGPEARSVLRWLRMNAEFLDSGGPTVRGRESSRAVAVWDSAGTEPAGASRGTVVGARR